ncbi:kinase-like domain-containing protein [Rhizophagus clarus]|uniref:Kinase-like domain-containing protein n=1 Tax=Rhizophagus clarus TaxID=94130 RepID=A0A8H3QDB1_9GLOM|nr:kinase-like domain-containing protein [Rhizophagus clarus]
MENDSNNIDDNNNNPLMKEIVNEIKLLIKANIHVNIIRFFGITKRPKYDDMDSNYLLILEYADSGTLGDYLRVNFNHLDWNIKLQFAIQIADAVSCLHKNDIIHRDLHSDNILVHQNTLKLTDFGLSRRLAEVSTQKDVFGRIAYIDPQHFKKKASNDTTGYKYKPNKKSDVYSVGVLLWEISSGKKPFESYDDHYQRLALLFEIPDGKRETPVPGAPNNYINIYTKCWQYNPDDRPEMNQVLNDLKLININETKVEDNNAIIINELLFQYENLSKKEISKQMEFIISIKEYIISKNQDECVIFNYLLNNKNNPQNEFLLAIFYLFEIGTLKNTTKSFELFKIAAEKGHLNSIYFLGSCYLRGIGTEVNEIKAFELYSKPAEKGHLHSIYGLGCCYQFGIEVNAIKAFELYNKAAEIGHLESIPELESVINME